MGAKKVAKKAAKKAAKKVAKKAAKNVVKKPTPKKRTFKEAAANDQHFTAFRPAAITFLKGLKRNNNKPWFEDHRDEYEREVKQPLLALIEEIDVRLADFIPEIIGSPKRSMFRIYRDVRFSKDKSPYKTHAACWFYHRDAGSGVGSEAAHGGAGFYFHFAPEGAFCGGGIWMPPRPALNRIRQSIADDHKGFEDIVHSAPFKKRFGKLDEEHLLTRTPRGFDPEHPAATWLRYQSFTAGEELTTEQLTSAKLPDILARSYQALTPFVRWLNTASGLKPSSGR